MALFEGATAKPFEPVGSFSKSSSSYTSAASRAAGIVSVERFELVQADPLDVAADAAFAERERHPRLEVGEDFRLHVGVGVEEVVQPVGPRRHQFWSHSGLSAYICFNSSGSMKSFIRRSR